MNFRQIGFRFGKTAASSALQDMMLNKEPAQFALPAGDSVAYMPDGSVVKNSKNQNDGGGKKKDGGKSKKGPKSSTTGTKTSTGGTTHVHNTTINNNHSRTVNTNNISKATGEAAKELGALKSLGLAGGALGLGILGAYGLHHLTREKDPRYQFLNN